MALLAIESPQNFPRPVQPLIRQNNDENNNFTLHSNTRRSLFKPLDMSSLAEIEMLLEEQHKIDKERFLNNYGIDIDNVENLESELTKDCCGPQIILPRLKIVNSTRYLQRRTFQLYNKQTKITDFCPAKRSYYAGERKTS